MTYRIRRKHNPFRDGCVVIGCKHGDKYRRLESEGLVLTADDVCQYRQPQRGKVRCLSSRQLTSVRCNIIVDLWHRLWGHRLSFGLCDSNMTLESCIIIGSRKTSQPRTHRGGGARRWTCMQERYRNGHFIPLHFGCSLTGA